MTATTNDAQSKFQLITETALPHKCVACGIDADGRREFIDFNISFDYEGAIYICKTCGEEIARKLGFISENEIDHYTQDQTLLIESLERSKHEVERLTSDLAAFTTVFDRIPNLTSFSAVVDQIERLRNLLPEETEPRPFK